MLGRLRATEGIRGAHVFATTRAARGELAGMVRDGCLAGEGPG